MEDHELADMLRILDKETIDALHQLDKAVRRRFLIISKSNDHSLHKFINPRNRNKRIKKLNKGK